MKIFFAFVLTATTLPFLFSFACANAAPTTPPRAAAPNSSSSSSTSSATTPASPRLCVTSTVIRPESIASRLQGDDSFDTEGIVAMGESAVAPLIELTRPKNRDSMVRSRSTHILGRFSCREALDQLDVLLGDSDFSVRLAAVVALSQSRGREATLQLVRMLADTDTGVLKFTVKELDRVGDKRAIGPLKTFRDSTPHSWLRERADAAIVAIGKRGV